MEPGKLIFSYQYESRLSGRVFGNRGSKITSQVYKGGPILFDVAYINIIVHHQVSLTSEDTTVSKLKFEREAMGSEVPVERYSTYNDIYTSKQFNIDLHGKVQGIRHSGLGGHHQNGVTDNEINNVV